MNTRKYIATKPIEEVRNLLLEIIRQTMTSKEGTVEMLRHSNFKDIKKQSLLKRYRDAMPIEKNETLDAYTERVENTIAKLSKLENDALENEVDKIEVLHLLVHGHSCSCNGSCRLAFFVLDFWINLHHIAEHLPHGGDAHRFQSIALLIHVHSAKIHIIPE